MAQWGYRPDGSAMIFEGELPEGWFDTPEVIEDETKRTAEAITDAWEAIKRDGLPDASSDSVVSFKRRPGRPRKDEQQAV